MTGMTNAQVALIVSVLFFQYEGADNDMDMVKDVADDVFLPWLEARDGEVKP